MELSSPLTAPVRVDVDIFFGGLDAVSLAVRIPVGRCVKNKEKAEDPALHPYFRGGFRPENPGDSQGCHTLEPPEALFISKALRPFRPNDLRAKAARGKNAPAVSGRGFTHSNYISSRYTPPLAAEVTSLL
jgi:hypothetical protein